MGYIWSRTAWVRNPFSLSHEEPQFPQLLNEGGASTSQDQVKRDGKMAQPRAWHIVAAQHTVSPLLYPFVSWERHTV